MKIKIYPTARKVPLYQISDEVINSIEFSQLDHGGKFIGNDDTRFIGIRAAERDEQGQLWLSLSQTVRYGHWTESDWIDAADYDPNTIYVTYLDKPHAGTPWAVTARGKVDPRTNEVIDV